VTVVTPNQLIAVKATVARVERVLRVRIDDDWLPGPGEYVFLANEGSAHSRSRIRTRP